MTFREFFKQRCGFDVSSPPSGTKQSDYIVMIGDAFVAWVDSRSS